MKKVVFFKNERAIAAIDSRTLKVQKIIQKVVNEFEKIGINLTEIEQITNLLNNQRKLIPGNLSDFVFSQLFPVIPMGLNPKKFREMINLPDLTSLSETFELLFEYMGSFDLSDTIDWQVYAIQDRQVIIVDAELEKVKSRFVSIAETQTQIDRLAAAQAVCESLNRLMEFATDQPSNYEIRGLVTFDDKSGKFIPASLFVLNGAINSNFFIGNIQKSDSLKSSPVGKEQVSIDVDSPDADRAAAIAQNRNL